MKKIIALVIFMSVSFLGFSKEAFMLRDNGPLRTDNGNGGVEWAITVPEGTALELLSETVEIKDLVMSKSTEKDCKFYKVKYSDKEYYALENEVGLGTKTGFIVDNATLFAKPVVSSFKNAFLPFGTFVVIGDSSVNMGLKFTQITFYDTDERVVKTRFIQSDKISTSTVDIETIQLVNKAKSEEDEEFKKELLTMASNKNSSENVRKYAEDMYNKLLGVSSFSDEDIVLLDEPLSAEINSDNVNYRSLPGTSGDVLGKFQPETKGEITLKTEGKEKIEDVEESWYFFTASDSEESGWVFGAYISFE